MVEVWQQPNGFAFIVAVLPLAYQPRFEKTNWSADIKIEKLSINEI